jgi:hypothetical protein
METFNVRDNAIEFIFKKTNLPRDVIQILAGVKVPIYWTERIKATFKHFSRPEAFELDEKIVQGIDFIWKLPEEEIQQTEKNKALDEYINSLQDKCGVPLEQAKIYASAMLSWYIHVEAVIIEALSRSKKN